MSSADHTPPASSFPLGSRQRLEPAVALGLLEAPVEDLRVGELAEALVGLADLRGRIDACEARLLARFEALGGPVADGARSAAAWVRSRTARSGAQAGAVARRARVLRSCPVVAEAFDGGLLGTEQVAALVRAREGFEDRFVEHEAELVSLVAPLTVDQTQVVARRWRALAEAEAASMSGEEDGDGEPVEARSEVSLDAGVGGRGLLTGDLDPEFHAELAAAIDAEIDLLFRRPDLADAEVGGDAGVGGEVPEAPEGVDPDAWADAYREVADIRDRVAGADLAVAERKAYALRQIIRRGQRASTHHGAPRPSLQLVIETSAPLPTPEAQPAVPADPEAAAVAEPPRPVELALTWDAAHDQLVTLAGAGPLSRPMAERILCECTADAIVWNPDTGEILQLGRSTRTPNAHQRRALRLRDKGCVFPGCTVGPDRCDAHHIVPWTSGGPTDLANLCLLCAYHHHAVHEGGFTLLRPGGRITVWRPDGTQLPRSPWGHQLPLRPFDPSPCPDPKPPWVGRPRPATAPPRPATDTGPPAPD